MSVREGLLLILLYVAFSFDGAESMYFRGAPDTEELVAELRAKGQAIPPDPSLEPVVRSDELIDTDPLSEDEEESDEDELFTQNPPSDTESSLQETQRKDRLHQAVLAASQGQFDILGEEDEDEEDDTPDDPAEIARKLRSAMREEFFENGRQPFHVTEDGTVIFDSDLAGKKLWKPANINPGSKTKEELLEKQEKRYLEQVAKEQQEDELLPLSQESLELIVSNLDEKAYPRGKKALTFIRERVKKEAGPEQSLFKVPDDVPFIEAAIAYMERKLKMQVYDPSADFEDVTLMHKTYMEMHLLDRIKVVASIRQYKRFDTYLKTYELDKDDNLYPSNGMSDLTWMWLENRNICQRILNTPADTFLAVKIRQILMAKGDEPMPDDVLVKHIRLFNKLEGDELVSKALTSEESNLNLIKMVGAADESKCGEIPLKTIESLLAQHKDRPHLHRFLTHHEKWRRERALQCVEAIGSHALTKMKPVVAEWGKKVEELRSEMVKISPDGDKATLYEEVPLPLFAKACATIMGKKGVKVSNNHDITSEDATRVRRLIDGSIQFDCEHIQKTSAVRLREFQGLMKVLGETRYDHFDPEVFVLMSIANICRFQVETAFVAEKVCRLLPLKTGFFDFFCWGKQSKQQSKPSNSSGASSSSRPRSGGSRPRKPE